MSDRRVAVTLNVRPANITHMLALIELLDHDIDEELWYEDNEPLRAIAECLITLLEWDLRDEVRVMIEQHANEIVDVVRDLEAKGKHPWKS